MSDELATRIFFSLVKDFRRFEGERFLEGAVDAFRKGIKVYRAYEFPALGNVGVFRFKAYRQMALLFKRYRFENDVYTDDQLENLGIEKYLADQIRLCTPRQRRASTSMVLREARRIARAILSLPYEPEKYRKIGKRAEVGCQLANAYLENKLGANFTCPKTLKNLLNKEVSQLEADLVDQIDEQSVDYLKLTSVNKNWKTRRWITPLTTAALYWSYGIKGYVEDCLKAYGLDIKRAESYHKILAKRFSLTRSHVTGDLSSASDSLTSELLNSILPRQLYTDVRRTFVRRLKIKCKAGTRRIYTASILPMGNAATFPLETLIFYCLIRAIGSLLRIKGTYSVYGDDLIYPTRIHKYVVGVFDDLGLRFNLDKTCVNSNFRESCGGDYYHGCDVRPFLFPEQPMSGGRLRQQQYLYKLLNTLLARWSEYEIPDTVKLLKAELLYLAGTIYYVPPSYPETSGLRTDEPPKFWLWPFAGLRLFSDGSCWWKFPCILESPQKPRPVRKEHYYLHQGLVEMELREWEVNPLKVNPSCASYGLSKRWYVLRRQGIIVKRFHNVILTEPQHAPGVPRKAYAAISSWT